MHSCLCLVPPADTCGSPAAAEGPLFDRLYPGRAAWRQTSDRMAQQVVKNFLKACRGQLRTGLSFHMW